MTPTGTPPFGTPLFALPGNLAAKTDPRLIAADERHLVAVAATLAQQIAELDARLTALRTASAGRGRRAMDRDLEIHRLSAQLRRLRRFGLDVCLGRMVFADGSEPVYVGRIGLADPAGHRLLIDWRTPAAEPFFAATHAHPLGLASRRRYRWSNGRITDYWDEVFTTDGLAEATAGGTAPDEDSAFIASLAASRSPRMQSVLGTIQADQDAIIRAHSHGALVVDGGPGTGKTVVALHRAAYLLYADPRVSDRRGGVLIVGPHRPYLAYIADVLPSLGEEGVQTCTLLDLLPEGQTAIAETDPEVARLKSSARLVEAVDPAVALYEEPPAESLLVVTPWADLRFRATDWAEAFDAVDAATPHNEAQEQVWEAVLEILLDGFEAASAGDEDVSAEDVRHSLEGNSGLRRAVRRAWPILEPTDLVADLWAVPAYLRRCAPWLSLDEARALRRPEGSPWTVADLPLLDAMRQRLGDPEAPERNQRRRAEEAADRAYMDDVVTDILAADDDPESGLKLLHRDSIRDSLVHDDALPGPDVDLLAGPFSHVIVDEAQELTDAEWQMLLRRCPSRSFTIVGDRAQARHGFTESWSQRLARVGFDPIELATLTVNYRTPEEVMAAAEPVIRAAIPDANVPTSIRRTGAAVAYGSRAELSGIVESWLATHAEGTVCVIADPSVTDPLLVSSGLVSSGLVSSGLLSSGLLSSGRVRSLTPQEVKGLEFDLVVLVDPEAFGSGIEGVVDRYVAMTRATQQLVILSSS